MQLERNYVWWSVVCKCISGIWVSSDNFAEISCILWYYEILKQHNIPEALNFLGIKIFFLIYVFLYTISRNSARISLHFEKKQQWRFLHSKVSDHDRSKLTQLHIFTSRKIQILSNTALRTSNLSQRLTYKCDFLWTTSVSLFHNHVSSPVIYRGQR